MPITQMMISTKATIINTETIADINETLNVELVPVVEVP